MRQSGKAGTSKGDARRPSSRIRAAGWRFVRFGVELSAHQPRHRPRHQAWPRCGEVIYQNYYLDATTYAEEVDYVRNFAVARIAWLDEQLGFVPTAIPASRQGQPATPIAIFSADGIRRSSLQPGLNIVRFSDGSTRRIWHL